MPDYRLSEKESSNLETVYRQLEEQITRVDFSALWKGFSPLKFAVYDDARVFFDGRFVEKTNAFTANTAIHYEGEDIAIWYLEGDSAGEDMEGLASKIIHEMFHAFQQKNEESRGAKELEALMRYRYHTENIGTRYREAELLRALSDRANDGDEAAQAERFRTLLALRAARKERFPYEYDYEARTEQIEGSANYVELKALEQLSPEKAAKERERLLASMEDVSHCFPVRPLCYASGAFLLELLHTEGYRALLAHDFDPEAFTDIPFADGMLQGITPAGALPDVDEALAKQMEKFRTETGDLIEKTLAKNEVLLEGDYPLVSPNIYDARYRAPYITSRFFVAYKDENEETQVIREPMLLIETDGNLSIKKVYRA